MKTFLELGSKIFQRVYIRDCLKEIHHRSQTNLVTLAELTEFTGLREEVLRELLPDIRSGSMIITEEHLNP